MMNIVTTKTVLGGKPRIAGTRISVGLVMSYIINGYSYKDIKRDYPQLTDKQVKNAKKYFEKYPERFNLDLEKA